MSHDQNNPQPQNPAENQEEKNVENAQEEVLEYDSFSDDLDDTATSTEKTTEPSLNEDQIRINVLEEELARTKDQMMRALAEAENGRKRALKEREDASKFAVSKFAKGILNVADNLRRALEAVPAELLEQNPQVKNLNDGIEATERELLRCFEQNGIQKTDPLNERFDPNFHEVMFEAPMPDKGTGTVIQVLEPGYIINGRILRPARVGVAKNADAPAGDAGAGHHIDTQA